MNRLEHWPTWLWDTYLCHPWWLGRKWASDISFWIKRSQPSVSGSLFSKLKMVLQLQGLHHVTMQWEGSYDRREFILRWISAASWISWGNVIWFLYMGSVHEFYIEFIITCVCKNHVYIIFTNNLFFLNIYYSEFWYISHF